MMRALLLFGWFVVPLVLLWMGQQLRGATPRYRRAFWGGVIGYCLGMVLSLISLEVPPVLWSEGPRLLLAFGGPALAWAVGAAAGALRRA